MYGEMQAVVVGNVKQFQGINGNHNGGFVWHTWDHTIT